MLRNNNRSGELSKREQFFEAVRTNDAAKLRNLITVDKCSVNLRMSDNLDTALHIAVRLGHIDIINVLLVYGADPKIENAEKTASGEHRYTPIKLARVLNKDDVLAEMAKTITNNANVTPEDLQILQQFRSGNALNSRPFQSQQQYQQPSQSVSQVDIFKAIQDGNLNDVKSWLRNGGDLTQKNPQGHTPLRFASMIESFEMITEIAQTLPPNLPLNTEDLQLVNLFRQVPYVPGVAHQPMQVSNPAAIPSLVASVASQQNPPQNQRASSQSASKEMYLQALEAERLDILEACLKSITPNTFIDMNSRDVGLHVAVRKKNVGMIVLLLSSRARLNIENAAGMNPLQLAISTGAWECVWAIINNYNYDLNGDVLGYISQFIQSTQKAEDQNKPNNNDSVAIIQAATSGDYHKLASLIPKGTALSSYLLDADDDTLLHWAAAQGNCEILKLILTNAVDLNITNKHGNTPIELAIINKQTEALKLFSAFVNENPDVLRGNKVDAEILASALAPVAPAPAPVGQNVAPMEISPPAQPQQTPREFYLAAIASGDAAAIQTALVHVSPDLCVDARLNTGLHLAVKANNPDLVKIYLRAKASINAKNSNGVTPIQLAMREGKWDIIKVIISNMNQKDNGIANSADVAAMYIANDNNFINAANLTAENIYTVELYIMSVVKNYSSLNQYVMSGLRRDYITLPVDKELNTVIHHAIQKNDEEKLRTLLGSYADATTFPANKEGLTPLQLALRDNKWNMVQPLLRFCNDKNDLRAVFIAAVLANKVDIVRILLQKIDAVNSLNFSINLRVDNKLNTALHHAVTKNMSDMMELLLGKRALITLVNSDQKSPLDLALENNAWDCIKMLVQRSGRINPNEAQFKSAFVRSITAGRMDVADIFLNGGIEADTVVDADENTCLHSAVQKKDRNFLIKLLGFGASPFKKNKHGKSAFELAVEANEWNLACLCIQSCSRDSRDLQQIKSAFGTAVRDNNWQVVETMINAGVDVDTILDDKGNTAMHYAAVKNSADLIATLVRKNANASAQNSLGHTPVMIGVSKKSWLALKSLVDNCPERLRANLQFDGLMLLAMREWQVELIESLLKTGINPTAYVNGETRTTYLHKAIEMKCPTLVRALVKAGHSLDQTNSDGLNPVQLAIRNQDWDSVQAIMESSPQGARVDTRILDTAISEAVRAKEYPKVLRLMTIGASTQFFSTPEGKALFQDQILPDKNCHEMLVSLIFSKKRYPEIRDLIANKYEKNARGLLEKKPRELNEEIADSEVLFDPIMMDEITDGVLIEIFRDGVAISQNEQEKRYTQGPYITPQGSTFQKDVLAKQRYKCPFSRADFNERDLIRNEIYFDLVLYYKLPHVDVTVPPPALINPQTKAMFDKPVVAADGQTYEREWLKDYLNKNGYVTPTGVHQQSRFDNDRYLNRQAVKLIECIKKLQNEAKAESAGDKRPAEGPAAGAQEKKSSAQPTVKSQPRMS